MQLPKVLRSFLSASDVGGKISLPDLDLSSATTPEETATLIKKTLAENCVRVVDLFKQ